MELHDEPPWDEDGPDLDGDEVDRDMEARLYSQIHHDVSLASANTTGIVVEEEEAKTAGRQSEPDSGRGSTKDSSDCSTPEMPTQNEDVICLSDDDSDSDSADEGIQVLPTPSKPGLPIVSLVSSDSEIELDDLNNGIDELKTKSRATRKAEIVLKNNKRKAMSKNEYVDVIRETSTPAAKRLKRNHFTKYVSARGTSSSSSSSSSEDENDPEDASTSIELNLKGMKNATGAESTFDGIIDKSEIGESESDASPIVYPGWTPEMLQLYNEQELPEPLTTEAMLDELPNDESLWAVDRADVYQMSPARSRYYVTGSQRGGPRCHNCNETGHLARSCPMPQKCEMCGVTGHSAYGCRNRHCLRCGQPGVDFESGCFKCRRLDQIDCSLCGAPGHVKANCPDTWRRYHATVSGTAVARPHPSETTPAFAPTHLSPAESYCPNCARKGHYLHQCRAYRSSAYPYSVLQVVSYDTPTLKSDWQGRSGEVEEYTPKRGKLARQQKKDLKAVKRHYRHGGRIPPEVGEPPRPVLFGGHVENGDDIASALRRGASTPKDSKWRRNKKLLQIGRERKEEFQKRGFLSKRKRNSQSPGANSMNGLSKRKKGEPTINNKSPAFVGKKSSRKAQKEELRRQIENRKADKWKKDKKKKINSQAIKLNHHIKWA